MISFKIKTLSPFFIIALFLTACDPKDPVIPIEPELITTVQYLLTPASGQDAITFNFVDLDGDGGNDPIITTAPLMANTTYTGVLTLSNEASTPSENITEEIEENDEEHQFFFTTNLNGLSVDYTDMDSDGNPIGLTSSLTTGDPGSGTLTITLRHEPNKSASGVKDGDPSNAGGETDIEVNFDVIVQ